MRAHEAGALHAEGYGGPPHWLPWPSDVMELLPQLWPQTVRRRQRPPRGGRRRRGDDRPRVRHRGMHVIDEEDFRARARAFREDFAAPFSEVEGVDVYQGKAFLCSAVARWVAEEGLSLDVCSGGELAVAGAGFPPSGSACTETTRASPRSSRRSVRRRPDRGRLVRGDRPDRRCAAGARRSRTRDGPGHRRGRGTHPRVHRHRPRGPEVRLLARGRARRRGRRADPGSLAGPRTCRACTPHIGSQIFDTSGFEVSARRLIALHAQVAEKHGVHLPEMDLGGGFGIAYTSEHTPLSPRELGEQLADLVRRELKSAR